MSKPSNREVAAVTRDVKELNEEQLEVLNGILKALGYTPELIAEMLSVEEADASRLLAGDEKLTGANLVSICQQIGVRPGVIQMRMNFDANETLVQKGRSWKGPHPLLTKGEKVPGQAFVRAVSQCSKKPELDGPKLRAIESGTVPVPLSIVRAVVDDVRDQGSEKVAKVKQFKFLEPIVDDVPSGMVTAEQYRAADAAVQVTKETKMTTANEETSAPVWSESGDVVQIDGKEFSLRPGEHMANVARRVRALIGADPEKPNIGVVLSISGASYPQKTKILASIEKGRTALPKEVICAVAEYYKVPVEALFTGVGLGIADPVSTGPFSVVSEDDEAIKVWCRDRLLSRRTELANDVDLRDLVELARSDDDMSIDWVGEFLVKTKDGSTIMSLVEHITEKTKGYGEEAKAIFWKLLIQRLGSSAD